MSDVIDIGSHVDGPHLPGHLYVHVPFCRSKCLYCDFYSIPDADENIRGAYVRAVDGELSQWAYRALPGVLDTVYIGGGTPTALGSVLPEILHSAVGRLPLRTDAEVTVEANPDTLTGEMVRRLAASGATRVSVGVQSFDDGELRVVGRRHDGQQAEQACASVVGVGLELNIDLMCGLPGQSMESWEKSLARALALGPVHVSVYPLSLESGTPLAAEVEGGVLTTPSSDEVADMMTLAEETLAEAGLRRYEVANFAVEGTESRHNTAYWTGRTYIGVGPAAAGMLDAPTALAVGILAADRPDAARVRYAERDDLEAWLIGVKPTVEILTAEEARREDVMLGLRLRGGVSFEQAEAAGSTAILESLQQEGLIERADGHWRTTPAGWLLGNEVFQRIWSPNP